MACHMRRTPVGLPVGTTPLRSRLPHMTASIHRLPGPASSGSAGAPEPDREQGRARIGIVYNPRSHRNRGQDLYFGGREDVVVATPQTRSQIVEVLADFAARNIEYLVINGGDGTVRDVLTCGHSVFGADWPVLAILPKGKTNALNVDLGAPADATLVEAIEAFEAGRRVVRRPLQITRLGDADGRGDGRASGQGNDPLVGFILGAGAFTHAIGAGQGAHKLGFFDSLGVGVTTGWGVIQSVFGRNSNPWRRGVPMTIRLMPGGEPAPHSGHGDMSRREILFVSTLYRMPMGLKPFGPERGGLKLAVMDRPKRWLMAALPLIVAGWQPKWLSRAGLHQIDAEAFELRVGGQFILDGEAFEAGSYLVAQGPELTFVVP